jgi:hypothetical protein
LKAVAEVEQDKFNVEVKLQSVTRKFDLLQKQYDKGLLDIQECY